MPFAHLSHQILICTSRCCFALQRPSCSKSYISHEYASMDCKFNLDLIYFQVFSLFEKNGSIQDPFGFKTHLDLISFLFTNCVLCFSFVQFNPLGAAESTGCLIIHSVYPPQRLCGRIVWKMRSFSMALIDTLRAP